MDVRASLPVLDPWDKLSSRCLPGEDKARGLFDRIVLRSGLQCDLMLSGL
jgi:hypothetical protein